MKTLCWVCNINEARAGSAQMNRMCDECYFADDIGTRLNLSRCRDNLLTAIDELKACIQARKSLTSIR